MSELTEANYSTGDYYHYTYDEVGNRLTEETHLESNTYVYDDANRLASVNTVNYTFDDNGNLLSDGVNTYTYDSANRLIEVSNQSSVSSYQYNGLGDRLSQTVDSVTTNYTLDLNSGLTQVLDDGTNTYTYGLGRISQTHVTTEYFLGDALGSVRQLTDSTGEITLAKGYDPYGTVTQSAGNGQSMYAYTGEQMDISGLTYLRARYYNPTDGRFINRDTWSGDVNNPLSLNRWMYVEGNPVNYVDPTGMKPYESHFKYCSLLTGDDYQYCNNIVRGYDPEIEMSWVQYFLHDLFGEDCNNLNLHESLPQSVYFGTWKEYGWWWHYLLEQTPGWWNDNGEGHVYFKDVLTFALAAELSTAVDREPDIVGYAAGAMANKGRSDGSFYKMIGSRQSVFFRINTALYDANSPEPGTPYNFARFGHKFGAEINNVAENVLKIRGWGNNILSNTGFTPEQKLAYEFGVVTGYSTTNFPDLMAALQRPDTGISIDQVLWRSDDRIAFIVSQEQLRNLCKGGSCVYKDIDN